MRLPSGRQHSVHVRLSDDEYTEIAGRAAAARLTIPSYLAAAGRLTGDQPGPVQFRAIAAEMMGLRRLVAGVARNVNQVAAATNTGAAPAETSAVLLASERVLHRTDDLLAGLRRYVPTGSDEE